jgi:hypothetical protein
MTMTMLTITVPTSYVDVIAEASISDTLGWQAEHGEPYPKRRHEGDDYNRAWQEACAAMSSAPRKRNGYTITISTLAARTVTNDLRWWSEYEERTTITYAQTRQCAKAADKIDQQLAGA